MTGVKNLTEARNRSLHARAIYHEVFEGQAALAAMERGAAATAGDLPVQGFRIGLDADQLVFGAAIRALETRYIGLTHEALPAMSAHRPNLAQARASAIEAMSR
jgi:hypothetical protein